MNLQVKYFDGMRTRTAPNKMEGKYGYIRPLRLTVTVSWSWIEILPKHLPEEEISLEAGHVTSSSVFN